MRSTVGISAVHGGEDVNRSLEGLDERILAITLKNNIRPYVPLYQKVPMHKAHHESQNKETDMQKNDESPANDYSTDPRYQAQIEGLQKMTAALNASSPEYQEPSEAENNRRISEKEERKAADWAKMQDGVSEPKRFQLSENKIRDILATEDEGFNPAKTGYYASVEELAEKVRSAKNWSQGEVFVFAESEDKFVVMKQIAPSSCEMLTITQDGYKDVLTAYRFEQDELVAMVKGFMGDGPSLEDESLRAAQEIGKQKELVIQADPAMGNKYEGKILGVTDQHVVVSLGRSALIVDKRDVDRVPAVEDNVKLAFAGGKGVFEVVKGVVLGR